jgi:hypothetical protein
VQTNANDIVKLDTRVSDQDGRMDTLMSELQTNRINETALLTELRTDMRYLREAIDQIRSGQK